MTPTPKLARPDVFHPRIVLAGCDRLPAGDGDDDGLLEALRTRGLHAHWLPWDDPQTLDADLVILRATWDYTERYEEFLDWTRRVRNLLNAPAVVEWNSDKRYLHDLAVAGIAVVETEFFAPDEALHLPGGEVVIKPSVGAGSVGAQRFRGHTAAREHADMLADIGLTVMVQPYDRRIEDGETALVFIAGEPSHAFLKGPMLPPPGQAPELDATGSYARERLAGTDADPRLWEFGRRTLQAAAADLGIAVTELLYARVDVIGGPTDATLLELELVEPGLGWRQQRPQLRSDAERRFAIAVGAALERLGLGPMSHRLR